MSGVKILGIDPGGDGGLAILCRYDGVLVEPMPTKDGKLDVEGIAQFVRDWAPELRFAVLEKVHGGSVGGVRKGSAGSFSFGKNFGVLLGVLAANGVPTHLVPPQSWMRAIHDPDDRKLDSKERSRRAYERLFPWVDVKTPRGKKVHMGMLEAVLIAEYGRREFS